MDACSALLRTLTDPPSVMRPQTVIHHAHAHPQPTTGRRRRRRPSQDSVQGQSSREHQQQHQQQHRQQEPHHNQHHPHHRPHHQHPHQHAPVAWQPSWLTLLVLGHVFVGVADGCIRRSIFEPQTSTSPPVMEEPPTSTISPSNKELCREDEDLSTGCLHGGTCYAIVLNEGIRQTFCQCLTEWTGRRCQLAFIDPGILAIHDSQMRTANIAAGVSVCILIVFVLLLAVFVYLRYRRKERLLLNREFEATAEELYRRPFSARSSIVESLSRPSSLKRPAPNGRESSHDPAPDGTTVRVAIEHGGAMEKSCGDGSRSEADGGVGVHLMKPPLDDGETEADVIVNVSDDLGYQPAPGHESAL